MAVECNYFVSFWRALRLRICLIAQLDLEDAAVEVFESIFFCCNCAPIFSVSSSNADHVDTHF